MKKNPIIIFVLTLFLPIIFANAQQSDSPWPVFHGNLKMTGQSPYDTSKITGKIKWKFFTEKGMEVSPIIATDGTIYVVDHSCTLYAVNPDGREKWRFKAGDPVYSKEWDDYSCAQGAPSLGPDGTIYFLPMTGYFFAVSPEGKEKWRYPVFTFKNAWPAAIVGPDGTIYVGSESYPPTESGRPEEKGAFLYAFNSNGTLKWMFNPGSLSAWVNPHVSIADDGTIYIGGNDRLNNCTNTLFALRPDSSVKWKFVPPNGVMEGGVTIGQDGTLYFSAKGEKDSRDANYYALTPDGKIKWKVPMKSGASITPALSNNGRLYFGDWDGTFYAFDLNGKELWRLETPKKYETLSSSPALGADGTIYFGTGTNYFYAVTPDGKIKWKVDTGESGVVAPPAIGIDGTIYVASNGSYLYALGEGDPTTETMESKLSNIISQKDLTLIGIIGLLFAVLIWVFKKKRKILVIVFTILFLILIGEVLLNYFKHSKKRADSADVAHQVKTPNGQVITLSSEQEIDTTKHCPRRVYGTPEKGYFGIYAMYSIDMTSEAYNFARQNCKDNVIWPEDMTKGYRGD